MKLKFALKDLDAIVEKFPFEQEKEYTWEELEKSYPLKTRKALEYFASSDLPNRAFLGIIDDDIVNRFDEGIKKDFCHIENTWAWPGRYGDARMFILAKRGLPRIADVKKEILIWWKDPNWSGFLFAHKFVMEHQEEFVCETKEAILLALEKKAWTWLYWLLELLYKDVAPDLTEETVQKIDEVIEFLDSNEIWANLINKYGDFIQQLGL